MSAVFWCWSVTLRTEEKVTMSSLTHTRQSRTEKHPCDDWCWSHERQHEKTKLHHKVKSGKGWLITQNQSDGDEVRFQMGGRASFPSGILCPVFLVPPSFCPRDRFKSSLSCEWLVELPTRSSQQSKTIWLVNLRVIYQVIIKNISSSFSFFAMLWGGGHSRCSFSIDFITALFGLPFTFLTVLFPTHLGVVLHTAILWPGSPLPSSSRVFL